MLLIYVESARQIATNNVLHTYPRGIHKRYQRYQTVKKSLVTSIEITTVPNLFFRKKGTRHAYVHVFLRTPGLNKE